MGENIFEKVAMNENRIVEFASEGFNEIIAFANIHLLFGAMLWPDERAAFESMVLGCLSGFEERTKHYNPDASEEFVNTPSYVENLFRQELQNNTWHGCCAGEAFLMYLQCKVAGYDMSFRKAQYLAIENSRGGRETHSGKIRTISDRSMRDAWKRFYNSLHIWAAYYIVSEFKDEAGNTIRGLKVDDNGGCENIYLIADIANQLRERTQKNQYMENKAQRIWEPIVFASETLPKSREYVLGSPTPEMISALESYELRDAKQRNKYKKIPFSGGS